MRSYLGVYDCLGPTQGFEATPMDPLSLAGPLKSYLSFSHQSLPHVNHQSHCAVQSAPQVITSTSDTVVRPLQATRCLDGLEGALMPHDRAAASPSRNL